jgi:hypothetical protein
MFQTVSIAESDPFWLTAKASTALGSPPERHVSVPGKEPTSRSPAEGKPSHYAYLWHWATTVNKSILSPLVALCPLFV